MRIPSVAVVTAFAVGLAGPCYAQQDSEIGYPKGSLGYKAIASADYAKAESQLRKEFRIPRDDPARLINHGHVLAKTGRVAEAAKLFQEALEAEEVELILADGRIMSSREAARLALQSVSVGGPESPHD